MIAHLLVVALAFLLLPAPVWAQAAPAASIARGYQRFYGGEVEAATRDFDGLRAAHPENLSAWLGALVVRHSRLEDDEALRPPFERDLDGFIAAGERRYTRSRADSDALFHLTQGYLLRSLYRAEFDRGVWGAARDAARAKGLAEEYLARHPEHGDAYLALGLYNYYVAIAPNFVKVLRVLLFLPAGNRAAGLQQIERAGRDGSLLAPLAQTALADIYGALEGRVADALPIAEQLVHQFPGNAEMRFALARLYMHPSVEAYGEAARQYSAVIDRAPLDAAQRSAQYQAILGLANLRRTEWRVEDAIALLTPVIEQRVDAPRWVHPEFLLRRANYRMLLNDPGAAADARRVRNDRAKMGTHFKAATRQLDAIDARTRNAEGAIYAALIPGNRLVAADRFDEAGAAYQRIAATAPGDWQVRYRLAYLEFARGNYPEAAKGFAALTTTRAKIPGWLRAAAMVNLAWTHDLAGRRADALQLYKRVVDEHEDETAAVTAQLGLVAPYRGPIARGAAGGQPPRNGTDRRSPTTP